MIKFYIDDISFGGVWKWTFCKEKKISSEFDKKNEDIF